jgi:hypothetical protein
VESTFLDEPHVLIPKYRTSEAKGTLQEAHERYADGSHWVDARCRGGIRIQGPQFHGEDGQIKGFHDWKRAQVGAGYWLTCHLELVGRVDVEIAILEGWGVATEVIAIIP